MVFRLLLIIICWVVILCSPLLCNTLTEYEQLYLEVFGEKLVEKRIESSLELSVNGTYLGTLPIEYLNMSETVFIKTDDFFNLLFQIIIKPKHRSFFKNELTPSEISPSDLKKLDLGIDTNLIKKSMSITLPYHFGITVKIDLNPNIRLAKQALPKNIVYPTLFSNYTNFAYKNDYDFNQNKQTEETLLFKGALGLNKGAILYNGKIKDTSTLNQLDFNKNIYSKFLGLKLGISPIFMPENLIYLTQSNNSSIAGITLFDTHKKSSLIKKENLIEIDIKHYSKIQIIVNSTKIYEKYHYPGKYKFIHIPLPSYRNDIWFNIEDNTLKQYHYTIYNSKSLAPKKSSFAFQLGLTDKHFNTVKYTNLSALINYKYGLSNSLALNYSAMIFSNELYQAYSTILANPLGLTSFSLLHDYSFSQNKSVAGLKFNNSYYIPNWLKKYLISSMQSAITYIPERSYTNPVKEKFLQAEHSVNFNNTYYETKLALKQNQDSTNLGIGLFIKAFRLYKDYYLSGGTNYESDTEQTITTLRLNQIKTNKRGYSRETDFSYSSNKQKLNSNITIKNSEGNEIAPAYELNIDQETEEKKKSNVISRLFFNNNKNTNDIANYTMAIQHDSKTSNTRTQLSIQNWAEDGFVFTSQLSYTLTPDKNNWALNLIGKYVFNIKDHQITPELIQGVASSDSQPKTQLRLNHLYDKNQKDKQIYMSSTLTGSDALSLMRYRDLQKDIRYELTRKQDSINQSLDYTNGFIKLSMIEKDNILSSTLRTAIAFTPSQVGIVNTIDSGFILYKPSPILPKNTKIYADSHSYGVFSAVGQVYKKNESTYQYVPNFKNNYILNSFETYYNEFEINYNSKNKYSTIEFINEKPYAKTVSYTHIKINNNNKKSSQKFNILAKGYHGYDLVVKDKKQFSFTAKFFDKTTKEPVEMFSLVRVSKLHKNTNKKYEFLDENSKLTLTNLDPGYYTLQIENYKNTHVKALNISYNEVIDLGNIYLSPLSKEDTDE